jgi:crotonobetainyl-CoA:carnitine CoA-transferase CaiB-like acyl-CoA transferase
MDNRATPLAGIQVIELGTMITCPLAGMLLAEMGANVIKVEKPEGDPFRGNEIGVDSPQFLAFNKGKRSVVLDLTTTEGETALVALLTQADVLIENFRPGVLDRLGFDAARLRNINPSLVHCSITGFGVDGPYKHRPSFDIVGQSLAGVTSLLVDGDVPRVTGPTFSDNITGMYAAIGVLGALVERASNGSGRRVEINMLEATIALIPDIFARVFRNGVDPTPYSRAAASQSFVFRCADDRLIGVQLSTQLKYWQSFLSVINAEEIRDNPLFLSHASRVKNYDQLYQDLQKLFAAKERKYWMIQLEENDVPFAPVHTASEVIADEQVRHLAIFGRATDGEKDRERILFPPIRFDGVRNTSINAPPTRGQHTTEILGGLKPQTAGTS